MGCVSNDGGHKDVGDCRRECSSHCSSVYLLKHVVAKSKVVVVNVNVQQASDEVRVKSEKVGFVVHFRVNYA